MPKPLGEVRRLARLRHYSPRAEKAYAHWGVRFPTTAFAQNHRRRCFYGLSLDNM